VDAAAVKIGGSGVESRVALIHHSRIPFAKAMREEIRSAFGGSAEDVCRMNFRLGRVFGEAAIRCVGDSGVEMRNVDAVSSHGQTICHIPPIGGRGGSTLQIGEPSVIARMTGVPVVSDFRAADMAAGGQGAPLVPYADYILFRRKDSVRAIQNIGGIANVTVVTPSMEDITAFDTGPGNCLMDDAMRALYGRPFDRGGAIARKGRVDSETLGRLLSHPYFLRKPPKSTGRELFGDNILRWLLKKKLRHEDVISTLAHFTALSIKNAYERFILKRYKLDEIIVSGGGTKNGYLMSIIRDVFKPVKVVFIDALGIPSGAKEALSFAILANETLSGNPSNLPNATGARERVILGKITLP
jgi:anhydro-N-acetylmuramic acid kinase